MSTYRQVHYEKPWKSYEEQVALLESRGLHIPDAAAAAVTLSHIKYYRFSGYCLAFETGRHAFSPGTTFDDVLCAYEFDRILRRLFVEALEWIEIDIRTAIAHEFGRLHGPFGHTNAQLFRDKDEHSKWIDRLRRHTVNSRETFARHHRWRYVEFPDLPLWAAVELMSMGTISHLFANMRDPDRSPVAQRYGIQPKLLESWLHHLNYVRNSCAHYARLWDKKMSIAPKRSPRKSWNSVVDNQSLYPSILVIATLLQPIDALAREINGWKRQLEHHIHHNKPNLPGANAQMGLPDEWDHNPEWLALEREESK